MIGLESIGLLFLVCRSYCIYLKWSCMQLKCCAAVWMPRRNGGRNARLQRLLLANLFWGPTHKRWNKVLQQSRHQLQFWPQATQPYFKLLRPLRRSFYPPHHQRQSTLLLTYASGMMSSRRRIIFPFPHLGLPHLAELLNNQHKLDTWILDYCPLIVNWPHWICFCCILLGGMFDLPCCHVSYENDWSLFSLLSNIFSRYDARYSVYKNRPWSLCLIDCIGLPGWRNEIKNACMLMNHRGMTIMCIIQAWPLPKHCCFGFVIATSRSSRIAGRALTYKLVCSGYRRTAKYTLEHASS